MVRRVCADGESACPDFKMRATVLPLFLGLLTLQPPTTVLHIGRLEPLRSRGEIRLSDLSENLVSLFATATQKQAF